MSPGLKRRSPDDFAGFAELRRLSPVPIATGEVLTRRQSFLPLFHQRAVDIVQPDCTKCGGLTEAWRIAWAAYDHNIQWVPHGWNTALGLAADIHLSCAMPVAKYVEFLTPSPYMDELIQIPFKPDAMGYLTLPEDQGLVLNSIEMPWPVLPPLNLFPKWAFSQMGFFSNQAIKAIESPILHRSIAITPPGKGPD